MVISRAMAGLTLLAVLLAGEVLAGEEQASPAPPTAAPEPSLGDPPRIPDDLPPRPARVVPMALPEAVGGFTVDTGSREEVRHFFAAVHQASEGVPIGWTGSFVSGDPGTTSATFKDSVRLRVNVFRALAGVPAAITFSDEWNAKAQRAAFMMSANDSLNHNPPSWWLFYTADGHEAAGKSNLAQGMNGAAAITGYLMDPGGNTSVGHRRWILYPQTQTMGTGDIPRTGNYKATNTLWIVDGNPVEPRPATRTEYVAWPPPGYIPYQLVYPRWSFSYPSADFSGATVAMTRGRNSLPVRLETVVNGYGENTVVWVPDNRDATKFVTFPNPGSDTLYTVTVSNVKIGGTPRSFSYDVTLFDPLVPGADYVAPALAGSATLGAGLAEDYAITPVPGASGYDGRIGTLDTAIVTEGAENGLAGVTATVPAGYNPVSTDVKASGAASFHLTHPDFTDQTVTLNAEYLPGSPSILSFKSRLGWSAAGQTALAEVSTDGGRTWQQVYQQAGTATSGEPLFVSRTVDLSPFAGQTVTVRFAYRYTTGEPAYTQTEAGVGWYLDDISISGAERFVPSIFLPGLSGPTLPFMPQETGSYFLQARGTGWGGHPFEWGPVSRVTVVAPTTLACTVAGDGSVTSSSGGLACDAGTCQELFTPGTSVTLHAVPSATSLFAGWSGACAGTGDCTVTMGENRTVAATFEVNPLVKVLGLSPAYFALITGACQSVPVGGSLTVLTRDHEFAEHLALNRNQAVKLKGGYDGSFAVNGGATTIRGSITVASGALEVEKVIVY